MFTVQVTRISFGDQPKLSRAHSTSNSGTCRPCTLWRWPLASPPHRALNAARALARRRSFSAALAATLMARPALALAARTWLGLGCCATGAAGLCEENESERERKFLITYR